MYLNKCNGVQIDHADVKEFSADVLKWWANHGFDFPTWAKALRIVGAFTPNSAAAERVFSALKCMFGDQQMVVLADYIFKLRSCFGTIIAKSGEVCKKRQWWHECVAVAPSWSMSVSNQNCGRIWTISDS